MTGVDTDLLPLTTLLPETAADPVVIYDSSAALRFAVAERDFVSRLGDEWDEPGNYILLDPTDPDGTWGCYVGKAAPGGVKSRLAAHARSKDHWRRAVIIQRDTTHGFNSAQVAWLEGRIYDLLAAADDAKLHNGNRPSDETLPAFERAMLEACVLPVRRVLRLLGHDPATTDDSSGPVAVKTRTNRFYGVKLAEIIEAGLIAPGTRLVSTNGAWPAEAVIVAGGVEYAGKVYPTPSGAAIAVKQGQSANGWDFWAADTPNGKVPLSVYRSRYQDQLKGNT